MRRFVYSTSSVDSLALVADPYILYTKDSKVEFSDLESAIQAYDAVNEFRFLYQPDKTYILGTVSVTGSIVGDDHAYHRDKATCYGLFIARSVNSVNTFLEKERWRHQAASKSGAAKMPGKTAWDECMKITSVNSPEWEHFEYVIQNRYLSNYNIMYYNLLQPGFGAIDIATYSTRQNPYRLPY